MFFVDSNHYNDLNVLRGLIKRKHALSSLNDHVYTNADCISAPLEPIDDLYLFYHGDLSIDYYRHFFFNWLLY